jgi:hypothetical protein
MLLLLVAEVAPLPVGEVVGIDETCMGATSSSGSSLTEASSRRGLFWGDPLLLAHCTETDQTLFE